ncbi:hypothetical protein Patl1_10471 [Pistacia atlantica]|uniref:Uncharacterized protein n=1 Tax=Pistacia atlantica TaxID=434234 RepID=A0ACC1A3M8_9ROSI|nr:hypothetical protein Patl1_10471 [Pistacia atlantica]
MDCSQFIDTLDSLWFFSNVLSSTTQQSGHASDEQTVQEEPENPIIKVEENQNLGQRCCVCGEFAPELEPQVLHLEPVDLTKPEEKIKSRRSGRRKRRSKRMLHERRKILGELDLGFDRNMDSDELSSKSWLFDFEETTSSGYQMFGSQVHYQMNMKMPPLEDGMAMKEHLKSWAYAVACTVR